MSKILQRCIDEAKRNANSVKTGWSITLLAYADELEKEIKKIKESEEKSFWLLNFFGIPKERAVTVENGIQVLQNRMDKEIRSLELQIEQIKKEKQNE